MQAAISISQMRLLPPTNRRVLCAQSQSIVASVHRHLINRGSPCPRQETSAACLISERAVARIDKTAAPLASCMPQPHAKTQKDRISNIQLDDAVRDQIYMMINQEWSQRGLGPTVEEMLTRILDVFPDKDDFPYRSKPSLHRVLKVMKYCKRGYSGWGKFWINSEQKKLSKTYSYLKFTRLTVVLVFALCNWCLFIEYGIQIWQDVTRYDCFLSAIHSSTREDLSWEEVAL